MLNGPMKLPTEADAKMAKLLGELFNTFFMSTSPVIANFLVPTLQAQLMQNILSAPSGLLAKC